MRTPLGQALHVALDEASEGRQPGGIAPCTHITEPDIMTQDKRANPQKKVFGGSPAADRTCDVPFLLPPTSGTTYGDGCWDIGLVVYNGGSRS